MHHANPMQLQHTSGVQFEARGLEAGNCVISNVVSISFSIWCLLQICHSSNFPTKLSLLPWGQCHQRCANDQVDIEAILGTEEMATWWWHSSKSNAKQLRLISFVCCNSLWNLEDFMVFRTDVMPNPGLLQLIYQLQAVVPCTFLEALFGTVYHVHLNRQGFSLDVNAEP